MTTTKTELTLRELISIQATDLSNETDNKVRLNQFYRDIESAKEQLTAILEGWDEEIINDDEYFEASNEADSSLIDHINRRL